MSVLQEANKQVSPSDIPVAAGNGVPPAAPRVRCADAGNGVVLQYVLGEPTGEARGYYHQLGTVPED